MVGAEQLVLVDRITAIPGYLRRPGDFRNPPAGIPLEEQLSISFLAVMIQFRNPRLKHGPANLESRISNLESESHAGYPRP
jgi:hypothetical protein